MFSSLYFYWCAYWKRFSPAPPYHSRRCRLIRYSGTMDPHMHGCVDRTKVMEILLLTYPHVLKQGFCHFVMRRLNVLFRTAAASTSSIPSTEVNNGGGGGGDVYGRRTTGTYFSLPSLVPEDNYQMYSLNMIQNQCSRHASRKLCRSHSARVNGSEGHTLCCFHMRGLITYSI